MHTHKYNSWAATFIIHDKNHVPKNTRLLWNESTITGCAVFSAPASCYCQPGWPESNIGLVSSSPKYTRTPHRWHKWWKIIFNDFFVSTPVSKLHFLSWNGGPVIFIPVLFLHYAPSLFRSGEFPAFAWYCRKWHRAKLKHKWYIIDGERRILTFCSFTRLFHITCPLQFKQFNWIFILNLS